MVGGGVKGCGHQRVKSKVMLHCERRVKGRKKREGRGLHIMQLDEQTKALQGSHERLQTNTTS